MGRRSRLVVGMTVLLTLPLALQSGGAAGAIGDGSPAYAGPSHQLWKADDSPGGGYGYASAPRRVLVDPSGSRVVVADFGTGNPLLIVYDAQSGAQLWNYSPDASQNMALWDATIDPSGESIYLATSSKPPGDAPSTTVVALDADSGQELWHADDTTLEGDHGTRVLSDGERLYVGLADDPSRRGRIVALSLTNGSLLWEGSQTAWSFIASPDFKRLFIARAHSGVGGPIWVTAIRSASGATLWQQHFVHKHDEDLSNYDSVGLDVTPDGKNLIVFSDMTWGWDDAAISALAPGDGSLRWTTYVHVSIETVATDDSRVYVSGYSWGNDHYVDYRTDALAMSGGVRVWTRFWDGGYEDGGDYDGDEDWATASAVSPDGRRLYVTGVANKYVSCDGDENCYTEWGTIVRSAKTGRVLWTELADGDYWSEPISIAVDPTRRVFYIAGDDWDTADTIAYRG